MNYLVFDLEYNQASDFNNTKINHFPKCPFEIIQIGAVKLDEGFRPIETLSRYVKPEIYPELHPFVRDITGISNESLNSAGSFREVYREFSEFVNSSDIFCIWGISDIKELLRNISFHKLDYSSLPKEYINVQSYASRFFKCPKGTNIGLRSAIELFNLPMENNFHDALYDALYTGEILKQIHSPLIKTSFYNFYDERKQRMPIKRTSFDKGMFIAQLEKMFGHQLSEEERNMVMLSYIMGRTNQFRI